MLLRQFLDADLACASYVVGSPQAGACVVVDPLLDTGPYLDAALTAGMRITDVVETHIHADRVSGARVLAEATGASVRIHETAQLLFPHSPLYDGDELHCGEVSLRVLHTPGHRPESVSLLVSEGGVPRAVLTGDALFVGGVGRPDLLGQARPFASQLYDSLFGRLLALRDDVEVLPAHTGGSACGAGLSDQPRSTIGIERQSNPALRATNRDAFIALVTSNLPPQPPNFERIVEINRGALAPPTSKGSIPAIAADDVARLLAEGAVAFDVRGTDAFCAGHVPGAINVWIDGGQFGFRTGWVVPSDARIVLISEDSADAARAARILSALGYAEGLGALQGGMHAWTAAGFTSSTVPQVSVQDLAHRLSRGDRLRLLDVREPDEFTGGHVHGALHIPFWALPRRFDEVPTDEPVAVTCAGGLRSSIAASVLQSHGFGQLLNVAGGMEAWATAGLPMEKGGALAA